MDRRAPASITVITPPTHVLRDLADMSEDELRLEVLRLRDELIGAQAEVGNLRGRLDGHQRHSVALEAVHRAQRELHGSDGEYVRIARRILGFTRWAVLRAPRRLLRRILDRG